MKNVKEFFNYYSGNHAYTEYSFLKTFIWKIGVLRRLFGDARGNKKNFYVNLKKLNQKHKLKSPKPALILATGPSLNEINLEFIDSFKKFGDTFSINYFPLTDIGLKSKIDFHTLLDVNHFNDTPNDLESKLRYWLHNEFQGKLITQIGRNITYKNEVIHIRGLTAASFSKSINPMGWVVGFPPYTTLYAISTAIWLGYKPIYVTGLDASQHAFINIQGNETILSNHQGGNLRKDANKVWGGRPDSTSILSSNAYVIEKMKLFKNHSVQIIGNNSHIDTLPRVSIQQILTRHLGIKEEK